MLEPLATYLRLINNSDTANMQIKTLAQGLGTYSVKRPFMNTQD